MLKLGTSSVAALLLTLATTPAFAQFELDSSLPVYRPTSETLKGEIKIVGSDTMSQVAAIWAEGFKRYHPDIKVEVTVKGSSSAVPAVMNGEATFGMMSRELDAEEVATFTKAKGYPPHAIAASFERLAIYVHKDNPVKGLTLAQVESAFAVKPQQSALPTAQTWGDLGVIGDFAKQHIVTMGRDARTGSQVFMQQALLRGGEFRADMKSLDDNVELVKAVAADPNGIGFAGNTYELPGIRAVPLSIRGDGFAAIDEANYPLVRPLQFIVDLAPNKKLEKNEAEFLKYVFSGAGQEEVVKAGFHPVSSKPATIALESMGLHSLN